MFPYPTGLFKWVMKAPLTLYRLGFGWLLGTVSVMVLTSRGHKSGEPRFTALECRKHGSKFYVISAWGTRAHWFQNLLANPAATVKFGSEIFSVSASMVEDRSEALRVIYTFRQAAPARYDLILTRFSGVNKVNLYTLPDIASAIKIIRLDIVNSPLSLPAIRADYLWIWPAIAGMAVLTSTALRFVSRSRQENE